MYVQKKYISSVCVLKDLSVCCTQSCMSFIFCYSIYMKMLSVNKKAQFEYNTLETYTAGIILKGHEVKSIKNGCSLHNAHIKIVEAKPIIFNFKIDKYKYAANVYHYDPVEPRVLLLNKREIDKLSGKLMKPGFTLIPMKLFISNTGYIKLEIAVCVGKTDRDKREKIKQRDLDRDTSRIMKEYI